MASFIIPVELKTQFEQAASLVSQPKGAILFRSGEEASGVFLIRKGRINLELNTRDGIYSSRSLGPGDVLGLPATLSGAPYSFTATIAATAELAFVPRKAVVDILQTNPEWSFHALTMLSEEISEIQSARTLVGAPRRAAK
jgi:CRP-like cAMP-binding protein